MKFKKPTSLFKCWLRNINFTQNTLDTRCQIKSPMWPHKIWQFQGGGKSYRWFTPQIAKYNLPQIVCMIYPPKIAREDLPLKSPRTIYPPSNHPILSKISNAHNIMLCFTKVFSAKDQWWDDFSKHSLFYRVVMLCFPAADPGFPIQGAPTPKGRQGGAPVQNLM